MEIFNLLHATNRLRQACRSQLDHALTIAELIPFSGIDHEAVTDMLILSLNEHSFKLMLQQIYFL